MTAGKVPTPGQVERALRVLARTFGPEFVPDLDRPAPAHVEFVHRLGGTVDTYRIYARDGERDVYLAQVGRDALEGQPPPAPQRRHGLAAERWTEDEG